MLIFFPRMDYTRKCAIFTFCICTFLSLTSSQFILEVDRSSDDDLLSSNPIHKSVKENPHLVMTYFNRHNANKPVLPPMLHPDYFQKVFISLLMSIAMEENRINRIRERGEKLHKNPFDIFKNWHRNKNSKSKELIVSNKNDRDEVCNFCRDFCKVNGHIKSNELKTTTEIVNTTVANNTIEQENITKTVENSSHTPQTIDWDSLFAEEIKIRSSRTLHQDNEKNKTHLQDLMANNTTNLKTEAPQINITSKLTEIDMHSINVRSSNDTNLTKENITEHLTDDITISQKSTSGEMESSSALNQATTENIHLTSPSKNSLKHKKEILTNFILSAKKNENMNRKRRNMNFEDNLHLKTVPTVEFDYLIRSENSVGLNTFNDENLKHDQQIPFLQPLFFDVKKEDPIAIYENTQKPKVEKQNYKQSILFTLPTIICIGIISFIIYFIVKSCFTLAKQRPVQNNVETGNPEIPVPQK